MKQTYRVQLTNGSYIDVQADSSQEAAGQVVLGVATLIPPTQDLVTCSTPFKSSPFTLRRMSSGQLILLEEGKNDINCTHSPLLNTVEQHIQFLECHIHELNLKIEALELACKAFVNLENNSTLQLRELCGYIENGTNTVVKVFQDDATEGWCVSCDNKTYQSGTMHLAIKLAYRETYGEAKNG